MAAKTLELFGFIHYPDMDAKKCVPNFMYKKTGSHQFCSHATLTRCLEPENYLKYPKYTSTSTRVDATRDKTGTDAEADSDDSGTEIAYSDSDYKQRDSD